jgi:glycosyltransferase involved in cell wall biosynthesis
MQDSYPQLAHLPIEVIPIGPLAHHAQLADAHASDEGGTSPRHHPPRPGEPVRVLIFGVVRPYKGHAELAAAVRLLTTSGLDIHVSVVGEVWQDYREPLEELAAILPADRLSVVDRYVADAEIPDFFAAAHLVVLPYRRCSASGPLHIAMSCGLPVVTTSVGGLVEATAGYTGAVLVPPRDPAALAEGIRTALPLIGTAHADPHSWARSAERYATLLDRLDTCWSQDDQTGPSRASGHVA